MAPLLLALPLFSGQQDLGKEGGTGRGVPGGKPAANARRFAIVKGEASWSFLLPVRYADVSELCECPDY